MGLFTESMAYARFTFRCTLFLMTFYSVFYETLRLFPPVFFEIDIMSLLYQID